MTVPSYDDLTPGIPNVIDSEKVDQLALFLDTCQRPSANSQRRVREGSRKDEPRKDEPRKDEPRKALGIGSVYACLRRQGSAADLRVPFAVARDFSPRVRGAGDREVLLDVCGLGRLIGPPAEIARQLARALAAAGAVASVGVGPTQTIARVLARAAETGHRHTFQHNDHQDQHTTRCELCNLHGLCAGACGRGPWLQLPVEWLQELEVLPPAMNQRDRIRVYETLERWGIATLGELAALPAAALSSRLGRRGAALQQLARGLDAAPFVPDGETPRYVARLELEWPIEALEPLSFVFARLLEPLAAQLERADRGAAAVRLELRLTDRSTHARVLQLPAPMRDPRVLRTLLLLDLESAPPAPFDGGFGERGPATAGVDIVTIELDPAPARITQFSLLQRALPSPETLSTLTARLSALAGESRVGSAVLVDTHRPDAFVIERYAVPGAAGADRAVGAAGAGADGAGDAEGAVLRRRRPAMAIRVSVEHGRPRHIAASRRGAPCGAVTQAAGPWRTSGNWWTETAWSRDEWDVALSDGAVCRIFQDRTTERWFLEGIYD